MCDVMRNKTLLTILASSSLLGAACTSQDSNVDDNDLLGLGDCSSCDDGGGEDGGTDGDDHHDGDTDVDLDVDLDGHAQIELAGTALWLGVDLGCLDLSGNFTASLDANVHFDSEDDQWRISSVNDASLRIEDDCQCSNDGLSVQTMTSITAHVTIDANENSCSLYCDAWADVKADAECEGHHDEAACRADVWANANLSCSASCDLAADITAHASLATNIDISLDGNDGDELEGDVLDLEFDDLLDSDGNVIDLD